MDFLKNVSVKLHATGRAAVAFGCVGSIAAIAIFGDGLVAYAALAILGGGLWLLALFDPLS
jgi:hypothetical protein